MGLEATEGLDGPGNDGGQRSEAGGVVLLHSHQPPDDVFQVPGPAEHVRVLQPGGNVALHEKNTPGG